MNLGGIPGSQESEKKRLIFPNPRHWGIHVCVFWFIVAPQRHPKVVKCSNARLFPDITGIHFVVGQALKIKSSSQSPNQFQIIQETQICRSLYCLEIEIPLTQKKVATRMTSHVYYRESRESFFKPSLKQKTERDGFFLDPFNQLLAGHEGY